MSGRIYLPNYTGAGGAVVWLDLNNGTVYNTLADADGFHYFEAVPAGSGYTLCATLHGYSKKCKTEVSVTGGANTSVSFTLIDAPDCDGDGTLDASDPDDDNDGWLDNEDCLVCNKFDAGDNGDDDSDGTVNCYDNCALDPGKVEPGVCGCGEADADADSDGAIDCIQEDRHPGAFQFGEAGRCTGVVTQLDYDELEKAAQGQPADYSGCYPNNPLVQDIDGDNELTSSDLSLVADYILGSFPASDPGGWPDQLALVSPPSSVRAEGNVYLHTQALNSTVHSQDPLPRPGWGVIYSIVPDETTCATAQLYGFPFPVVPRSGRAPYGHAMSVFDYTIDDGTAQATLYATGCVDGDVIVVKAYIPSDEEAGIWGHRFPNRLDAEGQFSVTVGSTSPLPWLNCAASGNQPINQAGYLSLILLSVPLFAGLAMRKFRRR